MSEPGAAETTGKARRSRRSVFVVLAGLVGIPVAFQKTAGWINSSVMEQPLMSVHSVPVALGEVPFETSDGASHTFADFKGQYLLVNLWATWCPPCRKEMPSLEMLQSFFQSNSRFRVIALSVDNVSFDQLEAFYSVLDIKTMALYRGNQDEVMQALGVRGFPTTLLLNPNGMEIARLVGPTLWDNSAVLAQINQLIGNAAQPMGAMN
jgi:thiol-disulfide isomerase/thioredoxin